MPTMALTAEQIVDVALRLLERDGLEGVSFRKVAAELDVSAPTLLWHVDNKRRLLDLMGEALMARSHAAEPSTPLEDEAWDAWLERRTRSMYATLIAHRDAPRVAAGNRPTVASLAEIESSLETLIDAGFEPGDAFETILTMGAFTVGCALEWQAEAARGMTDDPDGDLATEIRTGRYPSIVTAFGEHRSRHQHHSPHDHMFENGLQLLLAGLRARLADRVSDQQRDAATRRQEQYAASGSLPR
jgi:TetR/AcrR family transcriptional regulator, tetracycline repressor protein